MLHTLVRSSKARRGLVTLATLTTAVSPLLGQYQDFWENFEITRTASLSLVHDSSIFGNSSDVADTMLQGSLQGAITQDFNFATFGIEANAVFAQFLEFDDLNYEDLTLNWIIDLSEKLGNSRMKISANLNADETSASNSDLVGRATVRTYSGRLQLSYILTSRMTADASVNYTQRDPQSSVTSQIDETGAVIEIENAFGDKTVSGNLGLSWRTRGKFSYTLNGSASQTESERSINSTSQVYSLQAGVNGELFTKVTGSLSAGYSLRELDSGSTTTPVIRGRLDYAIDNVSSVRFTVSRSFEVSLNGSDSETTVVGLGYSRLVTRKTNFNANISYQNSDFTNTPGTGPSVQTSRDSLILSADLSYPLLRWLVITGDVRWRSENSDLQLAGTQISGDTDNYRFGVTLIASF